MVPLWMIGSRTFPAIGAVLAFDVFVLIGLASTCPTGAAERLPSGELLQDYGSVDGWSIRRVSAIGKVLYCEATWTREADLYVYVSSNPHRNELAFGVPTPIPAGRKQAKLRVWFDNAKADAAVLDADYIRTPISGYGDDGYLVALEIGTKTAAAAKFARARKVTFAYPFDGKTRVEAFPYKNGAKAMAKLHDCATER